MSWQAALSKYGPMLIEKFGPQAVEFVQQKYINREASNRSVIGLLNELDPEQAGKLVQSAKERGIDLDAPLTKGEMRELGVREDRISAADQKERDRARSREQLQAREDISF